MALKMIIERMDLEEIKRKLRQCGSIYEIYDAMDSDDMVALVRAATNAQTKAEIIPDAKQRFNLMKLITSSKIRNIGNVDYRNGRNKDALLMYSFALKRARKQEDRVLAYANRSAVLFTMGHFTACEKDIQQCLALGCPEELAIKLKARWRNIKFMPGEILYTILTGNPLISSFLNDFKFNSKRNGDVPCASADVGFSIEGIQAAAVKDIKAGTVVAIERAFVSIALNTTCTSCYFCHKLTPNLHPCNGCDLVLFCSDDCRETCMDEYHCIECQIIDLLFAIDKDILEKERPLLSLRAAIKLSLKMRWDAFITASEDIGLRRMGATVRQTYNSDEPLSILRHSDVEKPILEGRKFNGSIFCANALQCLDTVPSYFPKDPSKREAAKEAMTRIIMHLYVTFTNTIRIHSSAYNFRSNKLEAEVSINYGWFSMSSKLKHSCEPNVTMVALNDSVALVALKTIKKDQELTISYIDHPYDTAPDTNKTQNSRATRLFQAIRHICDCQNCKGNNMAFSAENKTESQKQLAFKLKNVNLNDMKECYVNACRALDEFPMYSVEHELGYAILRNVIDILQCKETDNKMYE